MKNICLFLTVILLSSILSCNFSGSAGKNEENTTINTTKTYELIADSGSIKWDRYLHQGPTTKKVKLFGTMADVSMGEIEISSNGEVKPVKGSLTEINGKLTKGELIFNMTTFRLNTNMEDKNDDLFKTKEYPESTYEMLEIIPDTAGYMIKGQLTIAKKTNKVDAHATISKQGKNGLKYLSTLTIKTLDWPLRDESAKKCVIKDEITIKISIFFQFV